MSKQVILAVLMIFSLGLILPAGYAEAPRPDPVEEDDIRLIKEAAGAKEPVPDPVVPSGSIEGDDSSLVDKEDHELIKKELEKLSQPELAP